jgi:hypothetical protein
VLKPRPATFRLLESNCQPPELGAGVEIVASTQKSPALTRQLREQKTLERPVRVDVPADYLQKGDLEPIAMSSRPQCSEGALAPFAARRYDTGRLPRSASVEALGCAGRVGDRVRDEGEHAEHVSAWLEGAGDGRSPEELVQLFERAFGALWRRASATLGEVTLTAIAERVLFNASESRPLFADVGLSADGAIDVRKLRERVTKVHRAELLEAIHFVLVELLTVLGNLTAEVLTPELHAELARVALSPKDEVNRS